MPGPSVLPPGIAPPLTENNDYNHNALIVIITSLSLFLVLSSFAIRSYACLHRGVTLTDDYILILVVIVACAQVLVTLIQVHYGWGKSQDMISSDEYAQMTKIGLAVDLLYILVLGLSKICTMMFYRNLSLRGTKLLNTILGGCAAWIILGMALLGVRCSSRPWEDINNRCAGLLPRWQAISALDITIEAVILAYPVKILYPVQLAFAKKIKVIGILSCRVILIPLSAVHLYYVHTQIKSSNPSLDGAYATTVGELHLGLSVVLLTISSLKMFVAVYEDEQGLAYTEDASKSHSQSGRTSRSRTWRASRPVTDPTLITAGWDEEPILPSSSTGQENTNDRGAIMKSVQIDVTRESIELGERHPGAVASGAL
ncbi:hypothetical protein EYZ11_008191 [Aspergillus tanneri]|uniref:Rhodopsin domain-containing protein n=1 Tax=Aspergillus tanneri TaxID=1220188 RepID=A0A4S3JDA6_9EURO|nr:hypothetical protein EYZ11_008191 [Aspergillus tanneri]